MKDITTYKNGKGHEGEQSTSGNFELINLNSISIDGGLKKSGKFIGGNPKTLKVNDLVMVLSDIAHGDLLGKVALIPLPNKYVLNQRVALLRPKDYKTSVFLFYRINNLQRHFKSRGNGTSQLNISKSDVENTIINIPNDVEEQKQIGKLLNKLDKIIDSNERKHGQLIILKKLLMEKLFNVLWRFKEFKIPWKQRKLSDISKITMGQSPSSEFYSDRKNSFILVQGNTDLKNGKVNPRIWTSVAKKIANNNEILITVRAPVGKLAITKNEVAIGRGVASIKGSKIIYYLLAKLNYEKYWDKFITGSTFESINSDILKNTQFDMPLSNDENVKLVKLIENVSKLIEFNEITLSKLRQLKKYLMQNMFI